jgi:hypothetical protein
MLLYIYGNNSDIFRRLQLQFPKAPILNVTNIPTSRNCLRILKSLGKVATLWQVATHSFNSHGLTSYITQLTGFDALCNRQHRFTLLISKTIYEVPQLVVGYEMASQVKMLCKLHYILWRTHWRYALWKDKIHVITVMKALRAAGHLGVRWYKRMYEVTCMGSGSMTVNNVRDTLTGSSSSKERRCCLWSAVGDPNSEHLPRCKVVWFNTCTAQQSLWNGNLWKLRAVVGPLSNKRFRSFAEARSN